MKPIGLLMIEHRRIERVVRLLAAEIQRIPQRDSIDTSFISFVVDFFRTYADRTHHGKEEDILFNKLGDKDLSREDNEMMNILMQEHVRARNIVAELSDSNNQYSQGDRNATEVIAEAVQKLVELYPAHIEKEDKHFFTPAMIYFSETEKQQLLRDFEEFDKKMIHEKYEAIVKAKEEEILRPEGSMATQERHANR